MRRLQERMVFRRNALNLSQAALAEKSGVSQRAIAAYETGASMPTHSRLSLLAKALDVSETWLMGAGMHDEQADMGARDVPPSRIQLREDAAARGTDLGVLRDEVLETMFQSMGEDLKKAEEPRRSQILETLDAVLQELRRRAVSTSRELILHKKGKARDPSSVLTAEEKAALAAHTSRVEPSTSSEESGPGSGAGGQPPRKGQQPPASSPGSKPQRPARGAKDQT